MIQSDQPTIFNTRRLHAAVSSKVDGNMMPKYGTSQSAADNLRQFVALADIKLEQVVVMNVSDHASWDTITDVGQPQAGAGTINPETRPITDAMVTTQKGLALLLPTADCYPVIMHDPKHEVLALAHLGWQSTEANLALKLVQHLQDKYKTNPDKLLVYLGPAIKAESYVFEGPVEQEKDIAWQPFLCKTEKGIGIDLLGYNMQKLVESGVSLDNIEICTTDTAASPDYFSHYRSSRSRGVEPEGRFATFCMLV